MKVVNWMPPTVDGREGALLDARVFWQSRMVANGIVPPPPEIIEPIEILKGNVQ